MKFTLSVAGLLVGVALVGFVNDADCLDSAKSPETAEYPSVDAGFLSALEWRFVGPYRGGRVVAVAGNSDDPLVFYFGAAHGGVWKTTDAGLRAQFDLMVDIRDRFTEVSDTVLKIREVRTLLEERRAELPAGSKLEADGILEQLRQIEGVLMIWMGSEAHPMMWSPPGLTEKLSSLSSAVISGDARPTKSMYAVFEEISKRFEHQLSRLNQIVEHEVEPLLAR